MQAMRMVSKKEISELIEREFGDCNENTPIASFLLAAEMEKRRSSSA